MDGQQRRSIGDRIADRLMKRVARRARVGLSADFLARFGLADPWADLLDGPAADSDGGMVFLSGKAYRDRLRRLAWMRQHREDRLAAFGDRFRVGRGPRALARLSALDEAGASRLRALSGLMPISAGDMHLPPPAPVKVVEAEAQPEVGPQRARQRGPGSRVAASPWLIRPFRPARVIRSERSARTEPASLSRPAATLSMAGPRASGSSSRTPALPASTPRHARRVAERLEATSSSSSPIVRFVEQESPVLRRSAGGRRVLRELIEIAHLDEAEQAVRIRKVLKRAGASRLAVETQGQELAPPTTARPSQRAIGRVDSVAGVARAPGLRPVMASAPSMRAVAPAGRAEPLELTSAGGDRPLRPVTERPVERASRRSRASVSASLFQSPVLRPSLAPSRSAPVSPMARARTAGVSSARRSSASTRRAPLVSPASAAQATAAAARGGASRSASSRPSASRSDDGPGLEGPQPGPASGLRTLAPTQAQLDRDSWSAPVESAPVGSGVRAGASASRSTARAAERLSLFDAPDLDAGEVAARAMPGEALPARFALSRSPRGAFVPAISLARPEVARSQEPAPTEASAPAARRERSAPTPAIRASYVSPVASSAVVASPRARATRVAEQRLSAPREREGSLLPQVRTQPRPHSAAPQGAVQPTGARRLAVVRLASGAYVARRTLGDASPELAPFEPASPTSSAGTRDASRPERRAATGGSSLRPISGLPAAGSVLSRPASSEPTAVTDRELSSPAAGPRSSQVRAPRSPMVAAHERSLRAPLTARTAQRVVSMAAGQVQQLDGLRTVVARARPNPLAYAARFGLRDASSVRVQEWQGPESARAAEPGSTAPRRGRHALDSIDLRALATASWADAPAASDSFARTPSPAAVRVLAPASAGSVLRPLPTRSAPEQASSDPAAPRSAGWRKVGARGESARPGPSTVASSQWAGARSARWAARSPGSARPGRTDRGGFDFLGVYRPPLPAAAPDARGWGSSPRAEAPSQNVLRGALPAASTAGGAGLQPGLPGAPRAAGAGGRPIRPDLGLTLGAVDQGLANKVMPTWAQRANGEPLIRGEGQFIEALARASEPEEILRVIYQRAARGGMTSASTGLPAPIIQVIEQIKTVAGQVETGESVSVRGGPSSDAEVVRRSGVRREAPRSTARVAGGMTALRSRGSATRRDGVGADGISKLSKKLQQLILLAEQQRQAARQQVRMAEDSASARSEGHAAPTSGEGGNDRQVDIEALGREVLEVVSQELEMRRVRSQEGSDEYGWW